MRLEEHVGANVRTAKTSLASAGTWKLEKDLDSWLV